MCTCIVQSLKLRYIVQYVYTIIQEHLAITFDTTLAISDRLFSSVLPAKCQLIIARVLSRKCLQALERTRIVYLYSILLPINAICYMHVYIYMYKNLIRAKKSLFAHP